MALVTSTRIRPLTLESFTDAFSCASTAVVGDLVRASLTLEGGVDVVEDNSLAQPVIGIIVSKASDTLAEVLILGRLVVTETLTKGKQVFLSSTGTFTNSPPTGAGYVQILGIATEVSEILFNPQYRIVKRNP